MVISEVYREIHSYADQSYVLAIFIGHPQGFVLRIYKNKTPVHWIMGGPGDDEFEQWLQFAPINPFTDLLESAKEWIQHNAS